MTQKAKAIIALTLALAMCAIFCMSAFATVTKTTFPIEEAKSGYAGTTKVYAASGITATGGTVTTRMDIVQGYKEARGTYRYINKVTGEVISGGTKSANTQTAFSVSVTFNVPNSQYQSWSLSGTHIGTNNGTVTLATAVQKQ